MKERQQQQQAEGRACNGYDVSDKEKEKIPQSTTEVQLAAYSYYSLRDWDDAITAAARGGEEMEKEKQRTYVHRDSELRRILV